MHRGPWLCSRRPQHIPIIHNGQITSAKKCYVIPRGVRSVANLSRRAQKDAALSLPKFEATDFQRAIRQNLRSRLKQIVKTQFGEHLDVQDISMWNYAHELHNAPMEYAVVDTQSEHDILLDVDTRNVSKVYDASQLAQALAKEGFDGVFRTSGYALKDPLVGTGELVFADRTFPWPEYSRPPSKELLYPTRLEAQSPQPFTITTPGPTVLPLIRLLSSYSQLSHVIPEMISFLYIWTRSHQLDEFTPTCLALMVIHFFQSYGHLPSLQAISTKERRELLLSAEAHSSTELYSPVLVPHQFNANIPSSLPTWQTVPFTLDISFVSDTHWRLNVKQTNFLYEFFNYWSPITSLYSNVISVREGKAYSRTTGPFRARYRHELPQMKSQLSSKDSKDHVLQHMIEPGITEYQHPHWTVQPLVVQDPFVFTHNHAETVSYDTLLAFVRLSSEAARSIIDGFPVSELYGPRVVIPETSNSGFDILARTISLSTEAAKLYKASRPHDAVIRDRKKTIGRVATAIESWYHRPYRVACFGSTCYGSDSAGSDLDLVILDDHSRDGSLPDRPGIIYNMKSIAKALLEAGFTGVHAIPRASVPIVKFFDPVTHIACDINTNDRMGTMNTALIKRYCELLPILPSMLFIIKRWAKRVGLNNPTIAAGNSATLSSYALTMMTIGLCQSKGWLANLQGNIRGEPRVLDEVWGKRGKKRVLCDVRFHDMHDWEPKDIDLGKALMTWFRFWAQDFQYESELIDIKKGGIAPRQRPFKGLPSLSYPNAQLDTDRETISMSEESFVEDTTVNEFDLPFEGPSINDDDDDDEIPFGPDAASRPSKLLCVTDPFIVQRNLAAAVAPASVRRFRAECAHAFEWLSMGFTLRELVENAGGWNSPAGDSKKRR